MFFFFLVKLVDLVLSQLNFSSFLVTRANPCDCSFGRLFETTPRAGNILKEDFATGEQKNREHFF